MRYNSYYVSLWLTIIDEIEDGTIGRTICCVNVLKKRSQINRIAGA